MLLCPRDVEQWIRTEEIKVLKLFISDDALEAASGGQVELRSVDNLLGARVSALVAAVDAERVSGFPSGRLFLDSVEQAIAVALVDGHGMQRPARPLYREGLTPSRLRRVTEFVQANIDGDLTLGEMAESVEMSVAYFAHMFRKSTGQSPHQFVLHSRVERAKAMLRSRKFRSWTSL
jgi:AraC family transcriptional regulator